MWEFWAGLVAGIWLAGAWGWEPQAAGILGMVVAVATYLVSCRISPKRRCWRCRRRSRQGKDPRYWGDGRGNLRDRVCRVCRGAGVTRRVGAQLIGAGR